MKVIYIIVSLLAIFLLQDIQTGTYIYSASHYSESIEIKDNNKFIYKLNLNFSQYEVQGNYHILKDSLILNSYPQKDKMIVFESNKGKMKNVTFEVKTKYGKYFTYDLHLILNSNEEITLKNQWGKSKFKNLGLKGFYIIDKNGLKSPNYMIIGTAINYFKVLFETSKVFENESWAIKNNKITPRRFNGELQNYYLEKK